MTISENNAMTRKLNDERLERNVSLPVERAELVGRARSIIELSRGEIIKAGESVAISGKTKLQTPANTYDVFFITTLIGEDQTTAICIENDDGDRRNLLIDHPEELEWIDAYAAGEIIVEVEKQLQTTNAEL